MKWYLRMQPPRPTLTYRWQTLIVAGIPSAFALLLYGLLLPRELSWANWNGDGGDFLAAILTGGVPHPTGYPTYVLLGRLFQAIPFGTPVWRGALLSALPAALAAGLLSLWAARVALEGRRAAVAGGLAAGLSWAAAPLVWGQAVSVEVHGLNSLFAVLGLWGFTCLAEGRARSRWAAFFALAYGVGLGNHLTLGLLLPLLVWGAFLGRKGIPIRRWLELAACLLAGLGVYLSLPLAAQAYPAINWGNPQTPAGLWWVLSGAPYRGLLLSAPETGVLARLAAFARLMTLQFWGVGLPAVIGGAVMVPPGRRDARNALLYLLLVYSAFALVYNTADSLVYLLPALMAAGVWLGCAWAALIEQPGRWARAAVILLAAAWLAALPFNGAQVNPRRDGRAAAYQARILSQSPQGALILTQGDADTFPLWFAHFGLRQRPDLRVVVGPLVQFAWYRETLARVYPDLVLPGDNARGDQVPGLNPLRPLCRTSPDAALPEGVRIDCSAGAAP